MWLKVILALVTLFLGTQSPLAARDRYFNDFDNGLGTGLVHGGYGLEDGGSYSDLSDLELVGIDRMVRIAGVGHHFVESRDGKPVGWTGQSLTHGVSDIGGRISVECDAEVCSFASGGGGFQLTLLVEFTPDDRVMFSLVTPDASENRQFEITVDENNRIRFTPRAVDIADGEIVHMKLEVETGTKVVRGWVNGTLWQQDSFRGTVDQNARAGLAATVRAPGDDLLCRFDNLSIAVDRRFRRGDVNGDGTTDISDAIAILGHLFRTDVELECKSAADVDDNGELQITDAVRILRLLFLDDSPIPAPSLQCGMDGTADELPCLPCDACRA